MTQPQLPSKTLKISYCFVLIAAALPIGLAKSAWLGMGVAMGSSGITLVSLLGSLAFFCLAIYRVYLVVRVPDVLASPQATGLVAVLRNIGAFIVHLGVVALVAALVAVPLMRSMVKSPTESGVEFFIVGVYLSLVSGIGVLGVFLFEFSRLLAFERQALAQRAAA